MCQNSVAVVVRSQISELVHPFSTKSSVGGQGWPMCLNPRFDGGVLSMEWTEALWDKFVTAAPRPRTPSEQQYSVGSFARGVKPGTRHQPRDGFEVAETRDARGSEAWPERAALDCADRGRGGNRGRLPAPYAAAAGRLPLCSAAVDTTLDAVSAASMPAQAASPACPTSPVTNRNDSGSNAIRSGFSTSTLRRCRPPKANHACSWPSTGPASSPYVAD